MPGHDSVLSSRAFGELADAGLVVAYQSHQDALRFLTLSLGQTNGVALLQGPVGSGKTTALKEQLAWSQRDGAAALVEGRRLAPRTLIADMLAQFGSDVLTQDDDQKLLQQLSRFVTERTRAGTSPVLIVDDADTATSSVMRLLNWLAGLESRGRFALRIILAGRERLAELVDDGGMRNFSRRHPATYSMNPLTDQETMTYLRTRWIAAGGEHNEKVFPAAVCTQLHEWSAGWPGALNRRATDVVDRMNELESARPIPWLHVSRDGQTLSSIELSKREYVIGRSDLSDIVIEDTYVSKIHAMLKIYANAVVLIDLNSTNGTSVNSRIVQKTVLRSNDVIVLGRYKLKIENVPALSADMEEQVNASDTMRMKNLGDLRRARARRTIKMLKHK